VHESGFGLCIPDLKRSRIRSAHAPCVTCQQRAVSLIHAVLRDCRPVVKVALSLNTPPGAYAGRGAENLKPRCAQIMRHNLAARNPSK
jgi:hypothetical protein